MIDWDLEAPGLHRYFESYLQPVEQASGLIDLFWFLRHKFQRKKRVNFEGLKDFPFYNFITPTSILGLDLMRAGNFKENYTELINKFNWEEFFNRFPDVFENLTASLSKQYDYILIDSRTGFTDTSGICTMIMPEKLVLVYTPNRQSLEGVLDLGKRAASYRLNSDDLRPLSIFPLPSRIEMAEKTLKEIWRMGGSLTFNSSIQIKGYQPEFEELFKEVYKLPGCDLTDYFNKVQIQHEPKYAYGEEIAVLSETSNNDRLSISKSYQTFLSYLISSQCIYKIPGQLNVFLSYHHESQDFADKLSHALEKKGIVVHSAEKSLKPGVHWANSIEDQIEQSGVFIPIISQQYKHSKYTDGERSLYKRIHGNSDNINIIPIVTSDSEESIPDDLLNFRYIDGNNKSIDDLSNEIGGAINPVA